MQINMRGYIIRSCTEIVNQLQITSNLKEDKIWKVKDLYQCNTNNNKFNLVFE